ncbi:hypothetical protein [Bdellovibrio sp. GT3]|uniref:hypothetical protein n=1 Tax=Bdellovibrio sp. GT3 TaxID=3136282 RepID=UPI0030F0CA45
MELNLNNLGLNLSSFSAKLLAVSLCTIMAVPSVTCAKPLVLKFAGEIKTLPAIA